MKIRLVERDSVTWCVHSDPEEEHVGALQYSGEGSWLLVTTGKPECQFQARDLPAAKLYVEKLFADGAFPAESESEVAEQVDIPVNAVREFFSHQIEGLASISGVMKMEPLMMAVLIETLGAMAAMAAVGAHESEQAKLLAEMENALNKQFKQALEHIERAESLKAALSKIVQTLAPQEETPVKPTQGPPLH